MDDVQRIPRRLRDIAHGPWPWIAARDSDWLACRRLLGCRRGDACHLWPDRLLILGIAHLWSRHQGAKWQIALETGLRPVAAGLILAAVYVLLLDMAGGWAARLIAALSTAILLTTRMTPLLLIGGGVALALGFNLLGLL